MDDDNDDEDMVDELGLFNSSGEYYGVLFVEGVFF